jgi:hypothetical protein
MYLAAGERSRALGGSAKSRVLDGADWVNRLDENLPFGLNKNPIAERRRQRRRAAIPRVQGICPYGKKHAAIGSVRCVEPRAAVECWLPATRRAGSGSSSVMSSIAGMTDAAVAALSDTQYRPCEYQG